MYGLVDRGLAKRPRVAKVIRGTVEFRFDEDFAAIRVTFGDDEVVVEDVQRAPQGRPRDPGLATRRRAAHRRARRRRRGPSVARGKVKIEGSPLLARRVLKLLEI